MPRLADLTKLQIHDMFSLEYAKWLSCLGETTIASSASELYLMRYPDGMGASIVKNALVPPGTTTDGTWAGPIVAPKPFVDAFIAIARSASLLGRIPGLRSIPFGVKVPIQTGDAGYVWVAQGAPKPVSKLAFSDGVTLQPTKCVGIVVLSRELIKLAVPGAEQSLRDTLIAGLTSFTDKSFLDPASTAIANVRPGSVTSGTVAIPSTSNYATDLQTLLAAFFAGRPTAPVLITNAAHAAAIGSMNAGGGVGLPVIVSEAALGNTIAMDPAGVITADDGVAIAASEQAMIQSNDAPDNPAIPATTVFTSLFQENLTAFRVERFVNWQSTTGAVNTWRGITQQENTIMRPEKLAVLIADAIRSVVAPLVKEIADLKGTVGALETHDARHSAAITELQKSYVDTRQAVHVLETHRTSPFNDMHANDPRH